MDIASRVALRARSTLQRYTCDYPYRRYFRRTRSIFIHIPRTAGTSVLRALADGGTIYRDHLPYQVYLRADRKSFKRYFKFAVVRDPMTRTRSVFEYLRRGGNQHGDRHFEQRFRDESIDFRRFVFEFLNYESMFSHPLFHPQTTFIFDYAGNLQIDQVVHFEHLDREVREVAATLGRDLRLPHENRSVSQPRSATESIDDDIRQRIAELYARDFKLLGYPS